MGGRPAEKRVLNRPSWWPMSLTGVGRCRRRDLYPIERFGVAELPANRWAERGEGSSLEIRSPFWHRGHDAVLLGEPETEPRVVLGAPRRTTTGSSRASAA